MRHRSSFGKLFQRHVDARPVRHRGGQCHDLFVPFHQLADGLAEDCRIGRRGCGRLDRLAGQEVKRPRRMPLVIVLLGGRIAFTLGRQSMHDDRAIRDLLRLAQRSHQRARVVAVNITYVLKASSLTSAPGTLPPLKHP